MEIAEWICNVENDIGSGRCDDYFIGLDNICDLDNGYLKELIETWKWCGSGIFGFSGFEVFSGKCI